MTQVVDVFEDKLSIHQVFKFKKKNNNKKTLVRALWQTKSLDTGLSIGFNSDMSNNAANAKFGAWASKMN